MVMWPYFSFLGLDLFPDDHTINKLAGQWQTASRSGEGTHWLRMGAGLWHASQPFHHRLLLLPFSIVAG